MDALLRTHDGVCFAVIQVLLRLAIAMDDWRRAARRRALRLRGSLRKVLRDLRQRHAVEDAPRARRGGYNRTPLEVEQAIVRLHVDAPQLGTGQLRSLAFRVLGVEIARETVRKILLRNRGSIATLEQRAGASRAPRDPSARGAAPPCTG